MNKKFEVIEEGRLSKSQMATIAGGTLCPTPQTGYCAGWLYVEPCVNTLTVCGGDNKKYTVMCANEKNMCPGASAYISCSTPSMFKCSTYGSSYTVDDSLSMRMVDSILNDTSQYAAL
jgi:hypothetical protein